MSVNGETNTEAKRVRRRRGRAGKVMLAIVLLIFIPLVVLWFMATQPLLPGAQGRRREAARAADTARLSAHVRALSETFAPRDAAHTENLDRVADYLRAEFERAGAQVSEQPFRVGARTYRNVIASFGPPDAERVVVGAHYDTAGSQPGADDNASGVAGLLELARLVGHAPPTGARLDLVAYTLEEPPYFRSADMGSRVHADSLRSAGVRVRAMLSLEMIGYFSDAEESQQFPVALLKAFYPSRGNFITVVGRFGRGGLVRRVKRAMTGATELPVYSINAPRSVPGVDFSDHLNYWNVGYEAAMITDTAFYRNPHYHDSTDTADTLDYRRMASVVEGVHAAVLELAR
ncbi:MAG TPA: M28 family peptidase [Pyrinomonadaceae bacterium]|nr:M28 family peptidase [Pyrinomonadaceae bacterium]